MKYLLLLLAIPFLAASDCKSKSKETKTLSDTTVADSLLPCLRKIIDEQEKEIPPNGPMRIEQYEYKGKTVYLFTAPCCDQYNTLYDDSCKMICAPTGGFSGRGDGKCEDFVKTAKLIKLVWTKK